MAKAKLKIPDNAEYYGWQAFIRYAERQGIALDDEDDWGPWWDCWKAGYIAAMQ